MSAGPQPLVSKYLGAEAWVVPVVVEGYLYGLYTAIFVMYLQHQTSRDIKTKILSLLLCVLYMLSTVTFAVDVATLASDFKTTFVQGDTDDPTLGYNIDVKSFDVLQHLYGATIVTTGLSDFIAQSILIYRSYIILGPERMFSSSMVALFPRVSAVILIFFLIFWMILFHDARVSPSYLSPMGRDLFVAQNYPLRSRVDHSRLVILFGIFFSLLVNVGVTASIARRIIRVYRQVHPTGREDGRFKLNLSAPGSKLRSVVFVMVESGMVLFAIQLLRICITLKQDHTVAYRLIVGIHQMLNGITPTIILVRVSMGLSYDDEESFSGAVGSLQCEPNHQHHIRESRNKRKGGQEEVEPSDRNLVEEIPMSPHREPDNLDGKFWSQERIHDVGVQSSDDNEIQEIPRMPTSQVGCKSPDVC